MNTRSTIKPAAILAVASALALPGAADAKGEVADPAADLRAAYDKAYEREYIEVRRKVVRRFDVETAGRNIVRDGFRENDGDVRRAREGEVRESTELMRSWLAPEPSPTESVPATQAAATDYDTAGAPTSVIECESGGDYGAVNPAGYYGAYQFDQSTWDAYAPSGYAGTNPAQAPPGVQDAAAAAVPYDAWPNC